MAVETIKINKQASSLCIVKIVVQCILHSFFKIKKVKFQLFKEVVISI
jgi:hypothetical protein